MCRHNADGKRQRALVLGAEGPLRREPLAARKPGSRADAGDGFAFSLESDRPFGRAVEQRHVFRQIGNLLPGLSRVESARKDEDANRFLVELLEAVDQSEAGRQAVVSFEERVARQQHEIDAAFEGHADEPFKAARVASCTTDATRGGRGNVSPIASSRRMFAACRKRNGSKGMGGASLRPGQRGAEV